MWLFPPSNNKNDVYFFKILILKFHFDKFIDHLLQNAKRVEKKTLFFLRNNTEIIMKKRNEKKIIA